MKRIAVSQRVITDDVTGENRDALDQRWIEFCMTVGITPVVLPNTLINVEIYLEQMKIEGFLLTGGNDTPERVKTERDAISYSEKNHLPLIGVCHGMQALGKFFGMELCSTPGHVKVRHPLNVESQTFAEKWYSKVTDVNSFHNHGFLLSNKIDQQIRVAAYSNGSIEAIEHTQLPFYGMMWHPEREVPFQKCDLDFFKSIFA